MVSRESIQRYVEAIAREFRPLRIILFGSHAYGEPTEDSDVDLMVVMPKNRWSRTKATDIRVRLGFAGFPLDLLVWTPERLREWSRAGDGFAREITERGTVLYERGRA
jgi:predicted nucleotidyltransferase